jgi:hypothetical protein
MNSNDMKELIDKYSNLLPVGTSISYTEAERRAGEFLVAMAKITDYKHVLTEGKIRSLSLHNAVYASQMAKGTAKTVTENKLTVEASDEYRGARENLEDIENDISYLKSFYEIFNNAHIFYRTMAKGVNE